jgi:molybdopterin-containing oxidoreductase family membrane subunit
MVIEIFKTIWYFIKYAFNGGWRHWAFILSMALVSAWGIALWAGVQAAPAIYTQLVNHLGFNGKTLIDLGIRPNEGGMIYTDMSDSVAWGMYISFFVFWVGVAAAGVLFGVAAYGFRDKGFMRLAPLAEAQAIAAVLVALALVFFDVGRPIRTFLLMAIPIMEGKPPNPKSIFTYDFLVLNSYLIVNIIGVFLAVHWYRRGPKYEPPKYLMYAFMVIADHWL